MKKLNPNELEKLLLYTVAAAFAVVAAAATCLYFAQ